MTVAPMLTLRPLGLGQLLDQAIRLYRRNFFVFIGIVAIVQVPLSLFQTVLSLLTFGDFFAQLQSGQPPDDPFALFDSGYFIGLGGSILLGIISYFLIQGVAAAALARAIAQGYLGESIGILEAYHKIRSAISPLIVALLLAIVLIIGLIIWFIIPCVGWITGAGMLAFFGFVIFPLIAPIVVLERKKGAEAIARAWELARRRFWWVLGFVLILTIFSQLIITGPVALVSFLFQFLGGSSFTSASTSTLFTLQTIVQALVGLIFSLVYLPLQSTGITLMYFDLRVRTEGFDLALLAEGDSIDKLDIIDITSQTPPLERGKWITMAEIGYFALVSLGALALYILLVVIFGAIGLAILGASGGAGF